jgi:multidrug efflux pump subunit AcrA (membrane-fusion protein)
MTLIDDIKLDLGDDLNTNLSDVQYAQLIGKAARRINRELSLLGTTDEISVTNSGEFINPDDDALRDIVVLQVECFVSQRNFSSELSSGTAGVRVVDGEQTIDTTSKAAAHKDYLNSPNSPCGQLQKAIDIEKLNRNTGKLVW